MNKKLLTGAAIAAAGVAATYLIRRKRNSSSAASNASTTPQGRSSKHMTDVFSNAKTASQPQAWSPAREESL